MNEREQATKIANAWLDGKMNALTQMVPGDPDCDACVLARQFIRATETTTTEVKHLEKNIETAGRAMKILRMAGEPGHDSVSLKLNSGLLYQEKEHAQRWARAFELASQGKGAWDIAQALARR